MNFIFHTLGCKVNQYETESLRECLAERGHTCDSTLPAEAIIINSCTVTAESDRKTRQLLRRLRRENPAALIVLTGCMVQAFPSAGESLVEADIVVGNSDIVNTCNLIDEWQKNRMRRVEITPHLKGELYRTPAISRFCERTRAFMKIEDGCDRYCSYCIIPTARGRVRSRALSDIKSEAEALAKSGYSEIVLTGINLSAYGLNEEFDLCDAVDTVCAVDGIKRVRLGSLEPDHITDGMLQRLSGQNKFCEQFHLSLQSGCDATLTRMNRHYDSTFYLDLVNRIRSAFPDAAITTDIMVGFAGESDEEFKQSLEFAQKVGFARAHIFAYSRREGTVAARLSGQVTKQQKESRARLMAEVTAKSEREFISAQCGRVFPVLFETCENGYAEGYTPNYTRVRVQTDQPLTGKIIPVQLKTAEDGYCTGTII